MSFTGKSPHLEGASHLFQQDFVPDYLLDLISRAAPSPLHSDPIFISPSFLCALWVEFFLVFFFVFFEAWFGWWDVAAIQRALYFSLLALKQRGGREGGRTGCRIEGWRDEGGGKLQTLFRTLVLKVLQYRWFEIVPQFTYIAGITVDLLSKAF